MTLNIDTTLRRQLSKEYEQESNSGKHQQVFHFCTSTFPYVTEISNISISSGLDAKAISRASTSSQPCTNSGQRRFDGVGGKNAHRIGVNDDSTFGHSYWILVQT